MGCSPSALLEQIHKGSSASLDKVEKCANKKTSPPDSNSLSTSSSTTTATTTLQINSFAKGSKRGRLLNMPSFNPFKGEPPTSATKYCDTCELEVPANKWTGHARTLKHRTLASQINVEDGVELVKTSFRNRISTFRLSSNQYPTSPKEFVNNLKPKVVKLVGDHLQKFDHMKVGVELFGRFLLPSEEREEVKSFNVRFRPVNANSDLEEVADQFNAILEAKFADFSEKDSELGRSVLHHRKSSLALTPEEEPLEINRGPNDAKYGLISPSPKHHLKLLLVFAQPDPVCETLSKAAEKLGFEITLSQTDIGALDEYQAKSHDLVIVDARVKCFDNDLLCRSIRNTKGSQHTVIIAIVRKSAFERDEVTIATLLDSGFNRCLIETTNLLTCVNEMILLKHSDIRTMAQHATCQALYTALDKCRDLVIVTDDSYKFQYMNAACEKQLGLRQEDTLGKTLQEQLVYDTVQINTMGSSLLRAREWSGPMTLKRKSTQETIVSSCRAVPFSCAGRMPTHFILVFDTNSMDPNILSQSRGSIHSIRRGSTDVRSVGSDYLRRTSLAKLNSLPLEAPITKIIGLIDQIRENIGTNASAIQLVDKVEDILKGSGLYESHVKDDYRFKVEEPVVSDLITALLSKTPQPSITASSRRSSNDSSVFRPSRTGLIKVPVAIRELLETSLTWEFDIFKLEDLTRKRPLQHLGMNLFNHFDVCNILNCDEKTLNNWLTVIEANYHAENSYHNSSHAADVMQATAGFLEKERMKSIMEPLDEATSLIAAAAHDLDHPGKSSAFLSNSSNPLAILYNDVSVLESHHAALCFKLTLGDERINIFKNLDRDTYKLARHNVIDMILATEMTKHFEHLAKFVNVFCTRSSVGSELEQSEEYAPILNQENTTLVKRMMIKCADVSNPTRPLRLCVEWARRIAEEYFQQTDDEKARGLPVVMPMFDRQTCSIPKSQIGFVDYIINDMIEAWNAFIDMPELLTYMRQNYIRWKEFDEQGHTTLSDIQKLQATVLSPSITSNLKSD